MPKIEQIDDNRYYKVNTGADFNRALGVLKDTLVIVDSAMASSRIVPTSFKYLMGSSELEVYIDGTLMRVNQLIDGSTVGDYTEYTNFSVKFNAGCMQFIEGAKVRFRITAANYKICSQSGGGGIDPSVITDLQNDVITIGNQVTAATNLVYQVGHDAFGRSYAFPGIPIGSTRTVGTIAPSDATPDLLAYRVWKTANAISTSITNFTGVTEDQRTILIEDNNTTFVHSAGVLVLPRGIDIKAASGEIYNFIFDGTQWKLLSVGGEAMTKSGMEKWRQLSGFLAAPASTSTLNMTDDYFTDESIIPGMALKYKIGVTYYYGICTTITAGLLTVAGAPLSGNVLELWVDESLTKTTQIVIPVEGYYESRAELILNGDFTTDTTNWTSSNSTLASVAGGYSGNCLRITNSASAAGKGYQDFTTVVGDSYYVFLRFKAGTSNGKFTIGTTANDESIYAGAIMSDVSWTLYTYRFTATDTTTRIALKNTSTVITNLSYFDTVYCNRIENKLLENFCYYYLPWVKSKAYCVHYSLISQVVDTASSSDYYKGKVSVLVNDNEINTVTGGLTLSVDKLKYETVVDINTSNYLIEKDQYIELIATPGYYGDARDLTVTLTFVSI